jgi:hypothetical protein
MDEFSDVVALRAGRWDLRFARVLAKVVIGRSAIAIIDANGADGGLIYEHIEPFMWDDSLGWESWGGGGGLGSGWTYGIAYAAGEAEADESIVVEFRGVRHEVEVQPNGYWLFAVKSDDGEDLPTRVL